MFTWAGCANSSRIFMFSTSSLGYYSEIIHQVCCIALFFWVTYLTRRTSPPRRSEDAATKATGNFQISSPSGDYYKLWLSIRSLFLLLSFYREHLSFWGQTYCVYSNLQTKVWKEVGWEKRWTSICCSCVRLRYVRSRDHARTWSCISESRFSVTHPFVFPNVIDRVEGLFPPPPPPK